MIRESAPAKVNLVLQVGARRDDGLHELCSLFCALELCDELAVEPAERDAVVCPGVEGPNLVAAAIARFRAIAPLPPLRVTITKRIPVAAGLGGGSADAAALLRVANRLSAGPLGDEALRGLAAGLGADVPSQLVPRHALVTGAGETVEPVALPPMALVLVPSVEGLATRDVYAEADRIGATRASLDAAGVRALAGGSLEALAGSLENDLERAAISLRPQLAETLAALRGAGALAARVTGSGPTAFGVFRDRAEAVRAAAQIEDAQVSGLRSQSTACGTIAASASPRPPN